MRDKHCIHTLLFFGFVDNLRINIEKHQTYLLTMMIKQLTNHKSGTQQQAVQCLSHVSSMNVAVVGVVVFAVSSLHCRQELCQARDWDLRNALRNHLKSQGSKVCVINKSLNSLNDVMKLWLVLTGPTA